MGVTAWGAAPEDWQHFVDVLRLESDLLPVVSNPKAKISARSKMRDLGKTPSRYDQAGEVVGIPQWTMHRASGADLKRWVRQRDYGICVQTREVRALDIDIADPVAAQRVREFVALGLGDLPMRRRDGTGKCLLAFRMPGEFTKRIIRTEHGLIEFLATGQQFIAVGTHPSGSRYEWVDADGVIGLPAAIPDVTPAEFETMWQALVAAFALPDGEGRLRAGVMPVKPRTISDLDDPAVVWLRENGWVREQDRSGRVDITCPWEHEHTTDSGPSSTSYFPAGVGGFEQGHFRCLHAHCVGRTDGDFIEALGMVADEFAVVEAGDSGTDAAPLPAFTRTRTGRIEATIGNLVLAVHRPDLIGCEVGLDEFRCELMFGEGGVWRPFTDTDYTRVRLALERRGFVPIGTEAMKEAVRLVAEERRFDSARQWIQSLRWDGVERCETFWLDHYGVPDTPYARAVGLYVWTALAARCVDPGHKADMVPVLVGLQGAGKTTAIEALCPIEEAFVEVDLSRKDEDIARSLRGKLVGEIAELKGLQGRDAESIKAWVSRRVEEWVPKYREFATRYARRALFIGTTNSEGFLDDDTGERRWLPMTVGTVDVAAVRAAREQLWAEGLVRFLAGGVAWQDAQTLAVHEHGKYKAAAHDTWLEAIQEWLARDDMDQPDDGTSKKLRAHRPISVREVLTSAVGVPIARVTRRDEMRVAKCLKHLGYARKKVREGASTGWRWVCSLHQEEHGE